MGCTARRGQANTQQCWPVSSRCPILCSSSHHGSRGAGLTPLPGQPKGAARLGSTVPGRGGLGHCFGDALTATRTARSHAQHVLVKQSHLPTPC